MATMKDIIDQFLAIPVEERRSVLRNIHQAAVPLDYSGFFVDRNNDSHIQRAETLFELDGMVNAQSIGFTVEMIPFMYPFLEQLTGKKRYLEALDVGSRTGAGASLLADLFMTYHSRAPTVFDTLDIDDSFQEYQLSRWPAIRSSLSRSLFDIEDGTYDYVVCSHTIEHIMDPIPFCKKMQRVSKHYVFVYCPLEEINPIPGHYTVTISMVDSLSPVAQHRIKSWWFRLKNGDRAECIFFVLPGLLNN